MRAGPDIDAGLRWGRAAASATAVWGEIPRYGGIAPSAAPAGEVVDLNEAVVHGAMRRSLCRPRRAACAAPSPPSPSRRVRAGTSGMARYALSVWRSRRCRGVGVIEGAGQ